MIVKLLTIHHLEFLRVKGGCTGSSESILVKMSNCWKSHVAAQLLRKEPTVVAGSGLLHSSLSVQCSGLVPSKTFIQPPTST